MPLIGLLIPAIAVACGLISRPASLAVLIAFVGTAGLTIPGMPEMLTPSLLLRMLFIGGMILSVALRHQRQPFSFRRNPDGWLLLFALNLILLMWVRGSGFAMLGSSTYGGTGYMKLFITLAFYFAAIRIRFSEQDAKWLLGLLLMATILPAVVQLMASIAPSTGEALSHFIRANIEQVADESMQEQGGYSRWTSLASLSYALIPVAYLLCRRKGIRFLLIGSAFFLVAMSGFRSRLIIVGLTVFLTEMAFSKDRMKTFFFWGAVGLAGLAFLMITAPLLPPAIQRAVAFLGFIPVDPDIAQGAQGTIDWRVDLWRDYCLPNVSKYLLIGRGLAHDISRWAWLQSGWYQGAEFFYYMGRYHSGPFSLLLNCGLLGTISFTAFFLGVIADAWKTVRRYAFRNDSLLSRYYVYLTIWMTVGVFSFYVIFGDVEASLGGLLWTSILLRVLKKNFLMESRPEAGMPEVGGQESGVRQLQRTERSNFRRF